VLSATMVEVDDDRLKVFANGPRWVSLSSMENQLQSAGSIRARLTLGELPGHDYGGRPMGPSLWG
jgi:hypothetical protein